MHTVIITSLSPFALIENVVSGEALRDGKFMAHKDSPGSRRRSMAALSADLQYSQNRLPLAGIFTILWRDLITLSLYCARTRERARVVTRGLFRQIRGELRSVCRRYGTTVHYTGAPACIVLAKIGLWLSISITRTDWLRSRAAYSPGARI